MNGLRPYVGYFVAGCALVVIIDLLASQCSGPAPSGAPRLVAADTVRDTVVVALPPDTVVMRGRVVYVNRPVPGPHTVDTVLVTEALPDGRYAVEPFESSIDTTLPSGHLAVRFAYPDNIFDVRFAPVPDTSYATTVRETYHVDVPVSDGSRWRWFGYGLGLGVVATILLAR